MRRVDALLRDGADCGEAAAEYLEGAADDLDRLQTAHKLIARTESGECWHWQGDGDDFPDSLVCPVVIDPDVLRDLLRDSARWHWWRENVGRVLISTAPEVTHGIGARKVVDLVISKTLDHCDAASFEAATDAAMRKQFAGGI